MTREPRLGVCLSGGGHRAALFGLGALKYLVDAGLGPHITVVSSVSGGSITNGWLGLDVDLTTVTPDEFARHTADLAGRISRRGTLWAAWTTYAFLLAMVAPLLLALVFALQVGGWSSIVVMIVAVLSSAAIAGRRSWVARVAFDRTLFHGRTLGAMQRGVDHVICTSDLQTCEPVYFGRGFVYSWRTGFGKAADLEVATAVQCSAAFPGAFPPVSLPTRRHGFERTVLRRFLLSDGGVYDNMATEWMQGLGRRANDAVQVDATIRGVDQVLVVNGSAGKGVVQRRLARVPIVGEVSSLLAVKDVLYDQTTAVRRRWLYARSIVAAAAPTAPRLRFDRVGVGADPDRPVAARTARALREGQRRPGTAGPRCAPGTRWGSREGVARRGRGERRREDEAVCARPARRSSSPPPRLRAHDGQLPRVAGPPAPGCTDGGGRAVLARLDSGWHPQFLRISTGFGIRTTSSPFLVWCLSFIR